MALLLIKNLRGILSKLAVGSEMCGSVVMVINLSHVWFLEITLMRRCARVHACVYVPRDHK